ncbi:sugar transporter SWEET1 isoform X2 [Nothobranchius furzeri]|uniref:sugar transporter SWEET1 isoform X2 n=1 Tax=Nothobranchius furzeri TaxID=105023 RepID=UPI003904C572
MDLIQLLSWACIVFTVGMFSTGLTDLKKMRESKSTENIQFLPFLITCLNNLGWLFYGILKTDQTIVVVNTIGALLQILYITMYFLYTKQKRLVTLQTLAAGTVLICVWLYFTTFLTEGATRLSQLGLTCSLVTIGMYMSPLIDLKLSERTSYWTWPGNPLGFTRRSWLRRLGRGMSGPLDATCLRNPTPDKRMKMDGWMDK